MLTRCTIFYGKQGSAPAIHMLRKKADCTTTFVVLTTSTIVDTETWLEG